MSPSLLSGFDTAPGFLSDTRTTEPSVPVSQAMGAGSLGSTTFDLLVPPTSYQIDDDSSALQGSSTPNPVGVSRTQSNPALQAPQHPLLSSASVSAVLIRQLAEFSINLDHHASLIPPLAVHRLGSDQRPSVPCFSLDRTFHLTQCLVDIYPEFIKTFVHKEQSDGRQPPFECLLTLEPSSLEPSLEPALDPTPNLDDTSRTGNTAPASTSFSSGQRSHASILLILSCHHRLIDIWESIFSHIYATPADTLGQHCQKFKIGSFVPSTSSSTVPLEIVMVAELATQLLERIQGLVDEIKEPAPALAGNPIGTEGCLNRLDVQGSGDQSFEMGIDATVLASEAVCNRAKRMWEEIGRIRNMIQERGREPKKATL